MLSQTAGYAILALSNMNGPDGDPKLVRDIADTTGIPKPYLSKLMHMLGRRGLILTKRGFRGGVVLSRSSKLISLLDIAKAVDGDQCLPKCLIGLPYQWTGAVCPTTEFWLVERARIEKKLNATSLASVAGCCSQPGTKAACCSTKAKPKRALAKA